MHAGRHSAPAEARPGNPRESAAGGFGGARRPTCRSSSCGTCRCRRKLAGAFQLRQAMAWQRVSAPAEVTPWFLRGSPGFAARAGAGAPRGRGDLRQDRHVGLRGHAAFTSRSAISAAKASSSAASPPRSASSRPSATAPISASSRSSCAMPAEPAMRKPASGLRAVRLHRRRARLRRRRAERHLGGGCAGISRPQQTRSALISINPAIRPSSNGRARPVSSHNSLKRSALRRIRAGRISCRKRSSMPFRRNGPSGPMSTPTNTAKCTGRASTIPTVSGPSRRSASTGSSLSPR